MLELRISQGKNFVRLISRELHKSSYMTPHPKSNWHLLISIGVNESTKTGADCDQVLTRIAKNNGADPAEFIAYHRKLERRQAFKARKDAEDVVELHQTTDVGDSIDLHDIGPVTIIKRRHGRFGHKLPLFICLKISDGTIIRGRIRKTADHELPKFIPC